MENTTPVTHAVGSPEYNELLAKYNALTLKSESKGDMVKRTEKGALAMHGLSANGFCDVKTAAQWMLILQRADQVKAAIRKHADKLYFASDEQKAKVLAWAK